MTVFYIDKSIGGRSLPDPYELNRVRHVFRDFGLYDSDETGPMVDAPLDKAIKAFQELRGLKVDGIINPGGETENAIHEVMTDRPHPRYVHNQRLENDARDNSIGFGGNPLGVLPTQNPHRNADPHILNVKAEPEQQPKRNLFDMQVPKPVNKPFDEDDNGIREKILKKDIPATFKIQNNPDPERLGLREKLIQNFVINPHLGNKAIYDHNDKIEKISSKHKIDPDLTRAIIWAENARGHKFGLNEIADKVSLSNTKMPMNINMEKWADLIGEGTKSLNNPNDNIEAGVILLKRIHDRLNEPTPEKIGSIWNYNGRENTNLFGEEVGRAYREKPWKTILIKPQGKPKK